MSTNDEYLRRNELCATADALFSDLQLMLHRTTKREPKWLRKGLDEAARRAQIILDEMRQYRDRAHRHE